MPKEKAHQHGRLWGRTRCWSRLIRKTSILSEKKEKQPPRGPAVAMKLKEPWHYTKASDFLLKVFSKEQGEQSHHRQRQLWKLRLYRIGGLFEVRDGATPSPIHHWVDQKWPFHQGNEFLSCSISIGKFIKILLFVMLSIWMHVTYFWRDYCSMMLTLPSKENICVFLWKGKRVAIRPNSPAPKLMPPIPSSKEEK